MNNGNGTVRGRTLKRRGGDEGQPAHPENQEKQNSFLNFLNTQVENAYRRPWHRLEHGLRLNRLRQFMEEESTRYSYSDEEKERLYNLLVKAHERKLLNSKNNVVYDQEEEKIKEIKGLVMHRNAEGIATFKILDKKAGGMTIRRRPVDKIESTSSIEDKEAA
jgi:hypothetical protein